MQTEIKLRVGLWFINWSWTEKVKFKTASTDFFVPLELTNVMIVFGMQSFLATIDCSESIMLPSDVSSLCRFCPENSEYVKNLKPSTFQSVLLFGSHDDSLQRGMETIEKIGVLRCATMFCTKCQRLVWKWWWFQLSVQWKKSELPWFSVALILHHK